MLSKAHGSWGVRLRRGELSQGSSVWQKSGCWWLVTFWPSSVAKFHRDAMRGPLTYVSLHKWVFDLQARPLVYLPGLDLLPKDGIPGLGLLLYRIGPSHKTRVGSTPECGSSCSLSFLIARSHSPVTAFRLLSSGQSQSWCGQPSPSLIPCIQVILSPVLPRWPNPGFNNCLRPRESGPGLTQTGSRLEWKSRTQGFLGKRRHPRASSLNWASLLRDHRRMGELTSRY